MCAQLQQTQAGDIFVCHDPFMSWAEKNGGIDTWAAVAYVDVVIAVPKGNPEGIKDLRDLARPGLRLGISDRTYATSGLIAKNVTYCISGQIVEHMLMGLREREAVLKNVRLETRGQRQLCCGVASGALDAAIVWDAMAHMFRDELDAVRIGEEYRMHPDTVTSATSTEINLREVKVTIGTTRCAKDKPRARRFYDFVVGQCGELFSKHGFRPVETDRRRPAGGSSRPSTTSPATGEKSAG